MGWTKYISIISHCTNLEEEKWQYFTVSVAIPFELESSTVRQSMTNAPSAERELVILARWTH